MRAQCVLMEPASRGTCRRERAGSRTAAPIHPVLRYAIAACYAYGAAVHVTNMVGLSGFDWLEAPLKWQVLDVACLATSDRSRGDNLVGGLFGVY